MLAKIASISPDFSAFNHVPDLMRERAAKRETAPTRDIFRRPSHPYTRALIDAQPKVPAYGVIWKMVP